MDYSSNPLFRTPPFLNGGWHLPKKGGLEIFLKKRGMARKGDPLRRRDWHEVLFFWSGLCIFLYFHTFNWGNLLNFQCISIFKAILVWYFGMVWGCQEGGSFKKWDQTPLGTMDCIIIFWFWPPPVSLNPSHKKPWGTLGLETNVLRPKIGLKKLAVEREFDWKTDPYR